MLLADAIHAGIVAFPLGWSTCPIHLFSLAKGETEGLVILPRPSTNHPDVADCFAPYTFDCRVLHKTQRTAWARAHALFDQFEAFKPSTGPARVWELSGWNALETDAEPPALQPGTVDVAGASLTDVTVTVHLLVRRV